MNTSGSSNDSSEDGLKSRDRSESSRSSTSTNGQEPERLNCCKIGHVAQKYNLSEYLTQEIGREWESRDGASLRDLARSFNNRVVRAKLADAGKTPLEGEVENIRKSLRNNDGTDTEKKRVERRLEDYGVTGNEINRDFISYRTVDRHFKNCENRTRKTEHGSPTESAVDRIRALENRLQLVSDKTLSDLTNSGQISLGDFHVTVNTRVTCNACGDQFPVSEALQSGCPICNDNG